MITIELQGLEALQRQWHQLAQQAAQALAGAVQAEAERILEASMPLVPVDTGLLVSTGIVTPRADGADMRYGGHGLAPYAVIVHEDTTMNHPNGGQHHYLSQPFFEATEAMAARLAADLMTALRG